MGELWDTLERPNLWVTDLEQGEKDDSRGIQNIFSTIIGENSKPREWCPCRGERPTEHQVNPQH